MTRRFDIAYGRIFHLLLSAPIGLGRRFSGVFVDDERVHVKMGWAFRATFPRSSITRVSPDRVVSYGLGVHGGGGTWVVNGTFDIIWIEIDPPVTARALFPIKLSRLGVSLEDPDGFVRELGLTSEV